LCFNSSVTRLRARFEKLLADADIRLDGDRPWDPQIHDERVFSRAMATGTLGIGEAYMDGWWDCAALDTLIEKITRHQAMAKLGSPRDALEVVRAKLTNEQRGRKAWKVGQQHYDLGNDLYEAMLDKRMMYSCGYWATAETLDQAQLDKLDLIAAKLGLEPGMRVLDIGCGWGGAAKHFAAEYGCQVVGVTVSVEQAELARATVAGLPVEIRVTDYRTLDEEFDRVYSIGMFEHVGHKNYRTYMQVVRRCLNAPDALHLLHTIGRLTTTTRIDPWIAKYIFPNSMLPSAALIARAHEKQLVLEDWHSFGPDYDRTLMAWHANVNAAWDQLPARYDERFRRMWNFYLLASAGSFRARGNQLWQLVLSRDGLPDTYRPARVR
jgi:cyclopropane-fatty-acyl-phospholipid synthase